MSFIQSMNIVNEKDERKVKASEPALPVAMLVTVINMRKVMTELGFEEMGTTQLLLDLNCMYTRTRRINGNVIVILSCHSYVG